MGQAAFALAASMMARTVRLQRPQSNPAPQASAICLDVDAPEATKSVTAWLVTPVHKHTNISRLPLRGNSTAVVRMNALARMWAFRPPSSSSPPKKSSLGQVSRV
jgi:hypothetical protein